MDKIRKKEIMTPTIPRKDKLFYLFTLGFAGLFAICYFNQILSGNMCIIFGLISCICAFMKYIFFVRNVLNMSEYKNKK